MSKNTLTKSKGLYNKTNIKSGGSGDEKSTAKYATLAGIVLSGRYFVARGNLAQDQKHIIK